MALYKGVIPKENPERRNKPTITDTVLERRTDKKLYGPTLPADRTWSDQTKEWYKMWRQSEIAPFLEPSDWSSLLDTAVLHNEFWLGNVASASMTSFAAEIRRRVAAYGATFEDRAKLRLKFADFSDQTTGLVDSGRNVAGVDYSSLVE